MSSPTPESTAVLTFLSLPLFSSLFPPPPSISSLSDGVTLFTLMSKVSSHHFPMESLTLSVGENWLLRVANLRKLKSNLNDYYASLSYEAPGLSTLDLESIAKSSSPLSIISLFEYVVGSLILCPSKATYIGEIMKLPRESQGVLKGMIEKAMENVIEIERERRSSLEPSEEIDFTSSDLETALEERDEAVKKCADLQRMLNEADTRISEANMHDSMQEVDELERANEKLKEAVKDMQGRMEKNETELMERRGELSKSKAALEKVEEELEESKKTNAEIRDDLDILQSQGEQLAKSKAQVESYKKRFEEIQGVGKKFKEVEEKCERYLERNLKLEQEVKVLNGMKKEGEESKKERDSAIRDLSDLSARLEVRVEEVKSLKDEVKSEREKAKLFEEELTRIKATRSASVVEATAGIDFEALKGGGRDSLERKEKLTRLEHEVEVLKAENSGLSSEVEGLRQENVELSNSTAEADKAARENAAKEAGIQVAALMKEIEKLQEEVKEEREGYAMQLAAKEREVGVKSKGFEEEMDKVKEEWKSEVEKLQREFEKVEEEKDKKIRDLEREVEAEKARGDEGKIDDEKLAEEMAKLRKEMAESREQAADQIDTAEREVKAAKKEAEDAKKEADELKNMAEAAKEEVETSKKEADNALEEVKTAKKGTEDAQNETEAARQGWRSAKEELAAANLAVEAAKKDVEAAKIAEEEARKQIEIARKDVEDKLGETAKKQLEEVRAEAAKNVEEVRAEAVKSIEEAKAELSKEVEAAKKATADALVQKDELRVANQRKVADLEEAKAKVEADAKKEADEARKGADEAQAEIIKATDSMNSFKEAVEKLTSEAKMRDSENATLKTEKAKIETYTKSVLHKFQEKYLAALTQCKEKLKEEREKSKFLEEKIETQRKETDREKKLLSSSIFELGLKMMENSQKS
ncbi:hypothetical protein TrST_g12019 [Triparma strigata]|uniref:HOOK N-terminal domain-containing protein n=1 Tax=Triparma strigata TaxID=1606541 RepID=A0A9W7B4Q1_9STRA|nr:hypothetical protein TrST_g12019 [Triparma strigata]